MVSVNKCNSYINSEILVQTLRQGKFSNINIGLPAGIEVLPKQKDSKITDNRFEDYPILASVNLLIFESN